MKNKCMSKKIISIVIMTSMLSSTIAFGETNIKKDESVYVNLNTQGSVTKEIVSDWIHTENTSSEIKDISMLKDIKNIKGIETPTVDGSNLSWKLQGKDLFYQGTIDKTLPLDIKIKYTLDGAEVKPEDIAGQSGRLKINIDFKNNDGHTVTVNGNSKTVYTPMTCIAVVTLPMENFDNVKINGGEIICDGSKRLVTFASLPGLRESLSLKSDVFDVDLPENLEINADITNFKMDPIIITATPELPEAEKFKSASNINELFDGIKQLKDASAKLADGADKLSDGGEKLYDGTNELLTGANILSKGSGDLYNGIKSINDGVSQIYNGITVEKTADGALGFKAGLASLDGGLTKLIAALDASTPSLDKQTAGFNALVNGMESTSKGADNLTKGAEDLNKGIDSLDSSLNTATLNADGTKGPSIKDGAASLSAGTDSLNKGLAEFITSTNLTQNSINDAGISLQKYLAKHPEAMKDSDMQQYVAAMEKIKAENESPKNIAKVKALSNGAQELSVNSTSLSKGISLLSKNTHDSLKVGSEKLQEGSKALSQGIDSTLLPGLKQLSEGLSSSSLLKSVTQLKDGSGALLSSLNTKIIPALSNINVGSAKLKEGSANLNTGINNDLILGVKNLQGGVKQLSDGSSEFATNMRKFNDDGICKIEDGVNDKIGNVQDLIDTKDALVTLSNNYGTFTGKGNDMDGKVKFIMRTDEIKAPETKTKKPSEKIDTPEEKQVGVLQWFEDFFKKMF